MLRLVGAVFGIAVTGALFKERENDKLAELLTASGANLDSSDRAEMRGLLSGSEAAQNKLARIARNVAHQIEQLVRSPSGQQEPTTAAHRWPHTREPYTWNCTELATERLLEANPLRSAVPG